MPTQCVYEELHNLYSSPNIIRMIKLGSIGWVGHVAQIRKRRNVYRIFAGKSEGKRPPGRPRHKWDDNIKIDLT
jgi:hypothetical protein